VSLGKAAITVCPGERKLSVRQSCRAHAHNKWDMLYTPYHVDTYHLKFLKTSAMKRNFRSQLDNVIKQSSTAAMLKYGTVDRL
jgi:hypothetical protein